MGGKVKSLRNIKFGRLLVLDLEYTNNKGAYWRTVCDCGNEKVVHRTLLLRGKTKSCGCLSREIQKNSKRKRERSSRLQKEPNVIKNKRLYRIWRGMKRRCNNKNDKDYNRYGGKGITICHRWLSFTDFQNDTYESYMNHVKEHGESNTTIDRIDTHGNYEPSNCRWATIEEQQRNRTNNKFVEYKGERYMISDLARDHGIKPSVLFNRLKMGWDLERALKTPIRRIRHEKIYDKSDDIYWNGRRWINLHKLKQP